VKLKQSEVIIRFKEKHGSKYDYSLVKYLNRISKVKIVCKKHGMFQQTPSGHLLRGCYKCIYDSKKARVPKKLLSKKELKESSLNRSLRMFEKRAKTIVDEFNEIHNHKYLYDKVVYLGMSKRVSIICKDHGIFKQVASSHLRGYGCNKCGTIRGLSKKDSIINRGKSQVNKRAKTIVADFNKIHNNKYSYEKVVYLGVTKKIVVICPEHGEFKQTPNSHLSGAGCYECGVSKMRLKNIENGCYGWSKTDWKKSAKNSSKFDSFKLYIIKLTSSEEEFYKIGITFRKLEKRFKQIPYKVEVVKTIEGEANYIYDLEKELHRKNKEFSYKPKIEFAGQYECFSKITNKNITNV
jgi:hypothetical protein